MSFGSFRLFTGITAASFCFWKRASHSQAHCASPNENASRSKLTHEDFFMSMALLASTRSKDNITQVGACVVTAHPHRLLSMGYNGMPDGVGFKDSEMKWNKEKHDYVCHAEMNAIISAFRRQADLSTCSLYVNQSPCPECAKLIAQSGIKHVVYGEKYKKETAFHPHLGYLPDIKIKQYEYLGDPELARIVIDLRSLKAERYPSHGDESREKDSGSKEKEQRLVKLPFDDFFMALAILATTRSQLKDEKKVGACVVSENPRRALTVGYNGLPNGHTDSDALHDDKNVCHAESNTIMSAFRYRADLTSSILYSTARPCFKCAQLMVQSGIRTVVYADPSSQTKDEEEDKAAAKKWESVMEIFYRAKMSAMKYKPLAEKKCIEIDLKNNTGKQVCCKDYTET